MEAPLTRSTLLKHHTLIALAALISLSACGGDATAPGDDSAAQVTPDGVNKALPDGKADAWNWLNNPARFQTQLEYAWDKLPDEGAIARKAWTASYWPLYQDGINHRWQGPETLSPAEKYDKAFNGWEPPEGFMDLKPFNTRTCEWDDAYYEQLGPAATFSSTYKGNARSRNGVDDDGDGISDKEECGAGEGKDRDGVETWWGLCHAWGPASILEDEPLAPVTRNGVTFDVSDIKGLLIQQYDRTTAYMIGARCNKDGEKLERDEQGRIVDPECRDINAGAWHVVIANLVGINKRGLVTERTYDYEVWNQPVVGYKLDAQREISLQEAHRLLRVGDDWMPTGEVIHDVEEGSPEADAILAFVNAATLEELDEAAGLDARAAKNIIEAREAAGGKITTLKALEAISYVASSAFGKLLKYALEHNYTSLTYKYNAAATRFVEVRMTLDWLTEAHQSTERTDTVIRQYTMQDRYHYILELNDEGLIIGGEWVGESITMHPDFIWLPVETRQGNPHISLKEVRDMVAESRRAVLGEPPSADAKTYALATPGPIPDYDPKGADFALKIEDEGVVRSVRLDLEIAHTYRGDLIVELRHGASIVRVFDGSTIDDRSADDVSITGLALPEFKGSELGGDWTLHVVDTGRQDVGAVERMSLVFEVE